MSKTSMPCRKTTLTNTLFFSCPKQKQWIQLWPFPLAIAAEITNGSWLWYHEQTWVFDLMLRKQTSFTIFKSLMIFEITTVFYESNIFVFDAFWKGLLINFFSGTQYVLLVFLLVMCTQHRTCSSWSLLFFLSKQV